MPHSSRIRGRVCGRCCVTRFAAELQPAKSGMGVLLYSYGIRSRQEKGFSEPAAFAEFCRERGAAGVQVSLGTRDDASAKKLRDRCGELGVYLEGIVRAPTDEKDAERFEAEIRTATACGADVVRTVLSPGRRYEVFSVAEDFPRFADEGREVDQARRTDRRESTRSSSRSRTTRITASMNWSPS